MINTAEELPRRRGRPRNSDVDSRTPPCNDRRHWFPIAKEVRIALKKGPLTPQELIQRLRRQRVALLETRQAIAWAEMEGMIFWQHGKWRALKSNGDG